MKTIFALFLCLVISTANAATISITIAVTAQPDVSKVYTLTDAEAARLVPAYQNGANVAINGNATRTQVLRYLIQTWIDAMRNQVQSFETVPAVVPVPINPQ